MASSHTATVRLTQIEATRKGWRLRPVAGRPLLAFGGTP